LGRVKGNIAMIILLYGSDTYRSLEKLAEFKKKFLREVDPSGLNMVELDGEKLVVDNFHSAVSPMSFLAKRRMVIVKELLTKNRQKTVFKDIEESILQYNDQNTIIIFWESEPNTTTSLFQLLVKQKYRYEFKQLTALQFEQWIFAKITAQGGFIERQGLLLLAKSTAGDLFRASQEIDKLLSYASGRKLSVADIELLVLPPQDEVIFHLTDALSEQDLGRFYSLLDEQTKSGSNGIYLLTMITKQLRLLLLLKEYTQHHQQVNAYSLAPKIGFHPYAVQKSLPFVTRFKRSDLVSLYKGFIELDGLLKIGQAEFRPWCDLIFSRLMK